MDIIDLPENYRYVVRSEGCGYFGARAWACLACAIKSIPIGRDRIVGSPVQTRHVCRISHNIFHETYVLIDHDGFVAKQFGSSRSSLITDLASHHGGITCSSIAVTRKQPVPFGRQRSDDVSELATVASVEAFLKGAIA